MPSSIERRKDRTGSSVRVEWGLWTFLAGANGNDIAATTIQRGIVPFVGTAPLQIGTIPIPSVKEGNHSA